MNRLGPPRVLHDPNPAMPLKIRGIASKETRMGKMDIPTAGMG